MTVLVPPVDHTRRPASGPAASLRARIRDLPSAIRASEYVAVGGGHRFRTVQRRRTRSASRVVFLVVAAFNVIDATRAQTRMRWWLPGPAHGQRAQYPTLGRTLNRRFYRIRTRDRPLSRRLPWCLRLAAWRYHASIVRAPGRPSPDRTPAEVPARPHAQARYPGPECGRRARSRLPDRATAVRRRGHDQGRDGPPR